MTTNFAPDRWHDHRGSTAQYLRNRFGVPTAWFRRSCSTPNAATMIPSPYAEERFITVCLVYPRLAHAEVAAALAAAPWAFVVYWPVLNQKQLITVVGASVADPVAFVAEHGKLAMAWYQRSTSELYQYQPRAEEDLRVRYATDTSRDYLKRGPKGLDHHEVHSALESGLFTVDEVCRQYGISRQTISNIRRKFNTFTPVKKRKPWTRRDQNDDKGEAQGSQTNPLAV